MRHAKSSRIADHILPPALACMERHLEARIERAPVNYRVVKEFRERDASAPPDCAIVLMAPGVSPLPVAAELPVSPLAAARPDESSTHPSPEPKCARRHRQDASRKDSLSAYARENLCGRKAGRRVLARACVAIDSR